MVLTNFNILQRTVKVFLQDCVLKIQLVEMSTENPYISKVTNLQGRHHYSISNDDVSYSVFISKAQIHFFMLNAA